MLSSYEWMIARRYLLPRKGEGFIFLVSSLALLGIAIGVMALIVVMSVMNGFRAELFDRMLGVNGHAVVRGFGGEIYDYNALAEFARKQPGILRAVPIIEDQVMVTNAGRATGALVRGIQQKDLETQPMVAEHVLSGSLEDFHGGDVIAIGSKLAERMLVKPGDQITLISPEGTATPFGTAPRLRAFTIAAIFEVGVYDYDNAFIFMPLKAAQTFFRLPDAVSGIEMMVDDPDKIEQRMAPLKAKVQPIGAIIDWRQQNEAFFTALEVERIVMFWILSIIIFVAAFNIISSQVMLVRSKSRDIAIMRTMGASRRSMMRVFMVAGGAIGVVGAVVGLVSGILIASNIQGIQHFVSRLTGADLWNPTIRFLTEMPSKTDPMEVAAVVGISLALTILATIYPAWRASRTDPVRVLRYE